MRAARRRGVEVIPELGRLVAHVPSALDAARREHALLGARRLLVAPDAGDQAVEAVLGQRKLEAFGLARRGARGRRQGRIDGFDRRARLDERSSPTPRCSGRGRRTSPGNFFPVSTCMTGNGTRPKKALRASQIITFESLPSDHSSATFFSRANASRKMKMLWDSRSFRRFIFLTPRPAPNHSEGRKQGPSLFLLRLPFFFQVSFCI